MIHFTSRPDLHLHVHRFPALRFFFLGATGPQHSLGYRPPRWNDNPESAWFSHFICFPFLVHFVAHDITTKCKFINRTTIKSSLFSTILFPLLWQKADMAEQNIFKNGPLPRALVYRHKCLGENISHVAAWCITYSILSFSSAQLLGFHPKISIWLVFMSVINIWLIVSRWPSIWNRYICLFLYMTDINDCNQHITDD